MTVSRFTYGGNPAASAIDAVRFLAGDTDEATAELDDREIQWALSERPDKRFAAALCLDALASKYSRKADVSVGEVSRALGSRAAELRTQAAELRAQGAVMAVPFFGGTSVSARESIEADTDAESPHMAIGQFDDPGALQFDSDPDGE